MRVWRRGVVLVRGLKLPLTLSIAGHGVAILLLMLLASRIVAPPPPAPVGGVAVVFSQSSAPAAAPQPAPPKPEPVKKVEPPPPPKPEPVKKVEPPPPAPVPVVQTAAVPLPPRKPIMRRVVHRVTRPTPTPSETSETTQAAVAPQPAAGAQTVGPVSMPASVRGPDPAERYVAMVSAWLERHKRYPDSAREHGEEGSVALRFRIERSGAVLGYSKLASTGYSDLDAGIDDMMRDARLPPFLPGMTESEVDISVTIRFNLTR
jgi:periplasmic protein TonB